MQEGEGTDFSSKGCLFELYKPNEWEALIVDAGFRIMDCRRITVKLKTVSEKEREMQWFANICKKATSK